MVRVDGCYCFDLKTGTLILAILGCVCSICSILILLSVASRESEHQSETLSNILTYSIAYPAVSFIVNGLLVVSIYKKSTFFFYPYLVFTSLQCIGASLGTIIFIILMCLYGLVAFGIIVFVILFCVLSFMWYYWFVAYSYYHELKVETECVRTLTYGNVISSHASTNIPLTNEKQRNQLV